MHPIETKFNVINLFTEGKSYTEISNLTGLPYQTIRKMVKPSYTKSNIKVGRPNIINKKENKVINQCVKTLKSQGQRITSKKNFFPTRD